MLAVVFVWVCVNALVVAAVIIGWVDWFTFGCVAMRYVVFMLSLWIVC